MPMISDAEYAELQALRGGGGQLRRSREQALRPPVPMPTPPVPARPVAEQGMLRQPPPGQPVLPPGTPGTSPAAPPTASRPGVDYQVDANGNPTEAGVRRTHSDGGEWEWIKGGGDAGGFWQPRNDQAFSEAGRKSFLSRPADAELARQAQQPAPQEAEVAPATPAPGQRRGAPPVADQAAYAPAQGADTASAYVASGTTPAVPPSAGQAFKTAIENAQITMGGEATYNPAGYWQPGPGTTVSADGVKRLDAAMTAQGGQGRTTTLVQPTPPAQIQPAAPPPVPPSLLTPPVVGTQFNEEIRGQAQLRARQLVPQPPQPAVTAQAQQRTGAAPPPTPLTMQPSTGLRANAQAQQQSLQDDQGRPARETIVNAIGGLGASSAGGGLAPPRPRPVKPPPPVPPPPAPAPQVNAAISGLGAGSAGAQRPTGKPPLR